LNNEKKQKKGTNHARANHRTISAKPYFNASLPPAPFRKEYNSFFKEIADSGGVTSICTSGPMP
jgi:hypothetical protein